MAHLDNNQQQPLSLQDSNASRISSTLQDSSNLPLKQMAKAGAKHAVSHLTPKRSSSLHHHHHHLTSHKTVTTPTSAYKKPLKLPILEQLSSGTPKGALALSTGRSHRASDKENNPFATLHQTSHGRSFLNNASNSAAPAGTSTLTTTSKLHNNPLATTSSTASFLPFTGDESETSFSISFATNDGDDNDGNDGSHTLTNAAAMINAKLEQLQDKENIPPPDSPVLVRRQAANSGSLFGVVAANASGIDLDLVQGLNRAFPVHQFKRQPLSVISVAHDDSTTPKRRKTTIGIVNNYHTPNPNHKRSHSMGAADSLDGDIELDDEDDEQEEINNGKFVYLNSQLAPEPGEEDEDDLDNMPDLDQLEDESTQQTAATESPAVQSPRIVFNPLNNTITTEDELVSMTPSAAAVRNTRSPLVLGQQDVKMQSPSVGARSRPQSQFQRPPRLQESISHRHPVHDRSSLAFSAPPSRTSVFAQPPPRFANSAPTPSTTTQPVLEVPTASLAASIHHTSRLTPASNYGVRTKTQSKKKMVYMR